MFSRTDKERLDEQIAKLYGHQGGDASNLRSILTELVYELRDAWVEIESLQDKIDDLQRRT